MEHSTHKKPNWWVFLLKIGSKIYEYVWLTHTFENENIFYPSDVIRMCSYISRKVCILVNVYIAHGIMNVFYGSRDKRLTFKV